MTNDNLLLYYITLAVSLTLTNWNTITNKMFVKDAREVLIMNLTVNSVKKSAKT